MFKSEALGSVELIFLKKKRTNKKKKNDVRLTDGHSLDVNQVRHLFVVCGATLLSLIKPHTVNNNKKKGLKSNLFKT